MADTLNITLSSAVVSGATTQNGPPLSFSDTNLQQHSIDKVTIPGSQVDYQISLDGITGKYVLLKFDGSVSVKLNGTGNTAIPLTASASNPAVLFLAGGAVTTVHVTNAAASAVICEKLIAV